MRAQSACLCLKSIATGAIAPMAAGDAAVARARSPANRIHRSTASFAWVDATTSTFSTRLTPPDQGIDSIGSTIHAIAWSAAPVSKHRSPSRRARGASVERQ